MVAALAFAMQQELPLPDSLRLAVAAGAAAVETNGSASELARLDRFSARVVLEKVGIGEGLRS
jgi:fructose-1-phosphate kinase PfkB-like protein